MSNKNNAPIWQQTVTRQTQNDTINALIENYAAFHGSHMLAKVVAVHNGGTSLFGTVDVLPMVQQQNAQGEVSDHSVITGVPYLRVQGGASALIIDPHIGDIGFIIVSSRDHSHVVTTRDIAPPASFRIHDMSDCVYVGGFLNDGPNQYIQFTSNGIRIVTPGEVNITASGSVTVQTASSLTASVTGSVKIGTLGNMTLNAKNITANCDISTTGNITAQGDIKAGSISLQHHKHGNVQNGGSTTSQPS